MAKNVFKPQEIMYLSRKVFIEPPKIVAEEPVEGLIVRHCPVAFAAGHGIILLIETAIAHGRRFAMIAYWESGEKLLVRQFLPKPLFKNFHPM